MRITIEEYDITATWTSSDTSDIPVVAEGIKGLLVQVGFHPVLIDNLFDEDFVSKWDIEMKKRKKKV